VATPSDQQRKGGTIAQENRPCEQNKGQSIASPELDLDRRHAEAGDLFNEEAIKNQDHGGQHQVTPMAQEGLGEVLG